MGKRVADMTPEEREERKANNAAYYAANKEKKLAYEAAYYAANKEKKLAYGAAYYAANREKFAAYRVRNDIAALEALGVKIDG